MPRGRALASHPVTYFFSCARLMGDHSNKRMRVMGVYCIHAVLIYSGLIQAACVRHHVTYCCSFPTVTTTSANAPLSSFKQTFFYLKCKNAVLQDKYKLIIYKNNCKHPYIHHLFMHLKTFYSNLIYRNIKSMFMNINKNVECNSFF